MSQSSNRLLFLFFILSLNSSLTGLFSCSYPLHHWFYLLFDLFYCGFSLLHFSFSSLNSLTPEFLFDSFFMTYISLLNFPFCSWIVFLITLNFLCFPVAHLVSSRQLFWVLYQLNCKILWLWIRLLEDYYLLVIFPRLLMFLEFTFLFFYFKETTPP